MISLWRRSEHPNAIPLAPFAELNEDYRELARLWVSDERSYVLISPSESLPPEVVGSLLVDCLVTAAEAIAAQGELTANEALAELWRGFDEERARFDREQQQEEGR